MNWININVTVLDSEEFLGAEPVERATWLCLLRYCVGQENGGRIVDAKEWKDRKWQQVVRVTLREIASECDLWTWDGVDLMVAYYPEESEERVKQKRETAKTNGARGGRPKKTNEETQPETQTVTQQKPTLVISEKAEGKGKGKENEKVREEREERATPAAEASPRQEPAISHVEEWSLDRPTEVARDFAALQSRINSLHPKWMARPHFTRIQQEELMANAKVFFDLVERDWKLMGIYLSVKINPEWGLKVWQPDDRGLLVASVLDVLTKADLWERECKKRRIPTGLEAVAATAGGVA